MCPKKRYLFDSCKDLAGSYCIFTNVFRIHFDILPTQDQLVLPALIAQLGSASGATSHRRSSSKVRLRLRLRLRHSCLLNICSTRPALRRHLPVTDILTKIHASFCTLSSCLRFSGVSDTVIKTSSTAISVASTRSALVSDLFHRSQPHSSLDRRDAYGVSSRHFSAQCAYQPRTDGES